MEIMRPENVNGGLSQMCIKGKIKITTRCLWLDKGKLLDTLYKAAHAALSSCPVNCPLNHMERTVSEVLRKVVRKYNSKKPEVIAVAVENPASVLADGLRSKLSGQSGNAYESKSDEVQVRKQKGRRREKIDSTLIKILDKSATDELEEDETSGSEAMPFKEAEDSWPSSDDETSPSSIRAETRSDSSYSGPSPPAPEETPSKSAKRNKWKPEEMRMLIKMRGDLNSRFKIVKGRMLLWEEISSSLREYGISRTPAQCKSLWASLVLQYEESNSGKKSKKNWPLYDDMHNILALREEAITTK